jgi:Ca2+-binding EF-hand superfamily protein
MTISRGFILTAAICGALALAGPADAKMSKKKKAVQPVPVAAPAVPGGSMGGGPMSLGGGMPGPGDGEAFVLRHFDDIDADKNGQLSKAEITAWIEKAREQVRARIEAQFRAADTNGDGQLSREEARNGAPHLYEHFEFVDANGDGQVTAAELAQLRDRDQMRQRILQRVKQADTNGDGRLDLAEVQVAFPGLAGRFAMLDRDGDGFLTLEDFGQQIGGF